MITARPDRVRSLAESLGLQKVAGVFLRFTCDACGHDQYAWCPFDNGDRIISCADCKGGRLVRVQVPGGTRS